MKVLIPGISSPVGRILATQLVDEGHEVVGLDRRVWRDPPPGVEFHAVDIRNRAAAAGLRRATPACEVAMATGPHPLPAAQDVLAPPPALPRPGYSALLAYGGNHCPVTVVPTQRDGS